MSLVIDRRGVSSLIFIVLTFSAFIMFIAVLKFYNVMIESPRKVVIVHQFDDLGNIIANDLIEIVVSLPDGGNIEYSEILPLDVAGQRYMVEINSSDGSVVISSSDYTVRYMLCGVKYDLTDIDSTSSGGKVIIAVSRK
jgi:hypothetical protein